MATEILLRMMGKIWKETVVTVTQLYHRTAGLKMVKMAYFLSYIFTTIKLKIVKILCGYVREMSVLKTVNSLSCFSSVNNEVIFWHVSAVGSIKVYFYLKETQRSPAKAEGRKGSGAPNNNSHLSLSLSGVTGCARCFMDLISNPPNRPTWRYSYCV